MRSHFVLSAQLVIQSIPGGVQSLMYLTMVALELMLGHFASALLISHIVGITSTVFSEMKVTTANFLLEGHTKPYIKIKYFLNL